MKLTEQDVRDLGFLFIKQWNHDHASLVGFVSCMDALSIEWRMIPSKEKGFEAVEIAGKRFSLEEKKERKRK